MVDQFRDENMEGGWDIILSMKRSTLIMMIVIGNFIVSKDDPMYFRVSIVWSLTLILVIATDNFFHQFQKMREI